MFSALKKDENEKTGKRAFLVKFFSLTSEAKLRGKRDCHFLPARSFATGRSGFS